MILSKNDWYRSKEALERLKGIMLVGPPPHVTPDGYAVLVLDMRGRMMDPGNADPAKKSRFFPPAFVVQNEEGHDLMRVADASKNPRIERVEFNLMTDDQLPKGGDLERFPYTMEPLSDVEPLVEYDHLPGCRKDYSVYPKGHKLA